MLPQRSRRFLVSSPFLHIPYPDHGQKQCFTFQSNTMDLVAARAEKPRKDHEVSAAQTGEEAQKQRGRSGGDVGPLGVAALWGCRSSGGGSRLPSRHLTFLPPREFPRAAVSQNPGVWEWPGHSQRGISCLP